MPDKNDQVEKLMYSVRDAATAVSVSKSLIHKAIREKRLRARKFGYRTLIKKEDLGAFIDNLERTEA